MAETEVHLELLLGRRVIAKNGKPIGRIEEIRATPRRGGLAIDEYLVGSYAVLERLSAWTIGRALLRTFGGGKSGYHIPWDKLDISDLERPRLLCAASELETFN
jgi:sporulation protein YlmC with PRC-barrel domain